VKQATGDERYNDVNYVFPTFITTRMPLGLVGLMIAAIFAAAMSASGGELNALATATIIDFYRRHLVTQATDQHYLTASKLATITWGLFACLVAMFAANQGSLIEVVNRNGSLYYGSLLGVFILAMLTKRATARGAFWGMIAGMTVVTDRGILALDEQHRLSLAQPDRRGGRRGRGDGDQLHAGARQNYCNVRSAELTPLRAVPSSQALSLEQRFSHWFSGSEREFVRPL
jgi:hypothetical protein